MKNILITGGTGSFGKTMAKKLLQDELVEKIVIFSRDELKQHEMRALFPSHKLDFFIGDVRDKISLKKAMSGVDVVFHAAALKHVSTGEFYPDEMVKTNILGTQNVIDAAEESSSVKKVIFLSTDKAVYPINAMGISKAMAEKLVIHRSLSGASTIFCSVRYGNVMMSRGSVIPIFIEAVKTNKEILITDSKMTRFLLSLDDAIDLVLLAIKVGEQGDLFIKKAPAVSVGDLAQAVQIAMNKEATIRVIGTRSGEKIHETLATQFELNKSEDLGTHYRIRKEVNIREDDFLEKGKLLMFENDYRSDNTDQLSIEQTVSLLTSLPSFNEALKSK